MSIIQIKEGKATLGEIIKEFGNKEYNYIELRCRYTDKDNSAKDIFVGCCSFKNGELISLDGDTYSLDDTFDEWLETIESEKCQDKNKANLTVWHSGYIE